MQSAPSSYLVQESVKEKMDEIERLLDGNTSQ